MTWMAAFAAAAIGVRTTWMAAFAAPAHCQRAARKPWKAAPALQRSGSVSCYLLQFLGCPQPQCDQSCIAVGVGDSNRIADQLRHQQGMIINWHVGRTSPAAGGSGEC